MARADFHLQDAFAVLERFVLPCNGCIAPLQVLQDWLEEGIIGASRLYVAFRIKLLFKSVCDAHESSGAVQIVTQMCKTL